MLNILIAGISLAASPVCDAVLDSNRRPWGLEINVTSAGNTDCFYSIQIAGEILQTDSLKVVEFAKPSRLAINGCLPARDSRISCILGLPPGGIASILMLAPRAQLDAERCFVVSARSQPNFLAPGNERSGGRDQQTVCF